MAIRVHNIKHHSTKIICCHTRGRVISSLIMYLLDRDHPHFYFWTKHPARELLKKGNFNWYCGCGMADKSYDGDVDSRIFFFWLTSKLSRPSSTAFLREAIFLHLRQATNPDQRHRSGFLSVSQRFIIARSRWWKEDLWVDESDLSRVCAWRQIAEHAFIRWIW